VLPTCTVLNTAPILVQQQLILILQIVNQLCATLNNVLEKTQQLTDELGQLIPALTALSHTRNPALFDLYTCQKHLPAQLQNAIIPALDHTTTLQLHAHLAKLVANPCTIFYMLPQSRSPSFSNAIFYHWKLAPSAHAPAQTCNSHNLPYV